MNRADNIKNKFAEKFGCQPVGITQAPGRVNLIGEHTDYNDGFVLPIAIQRNTAAAFCPNDSSVIRAASLQQDGKDAVIDITSAITKGEPKWANYPKGVLAGMLEKGVKVRGMDILFDSDVPIGGGLSSSASLEVAAAMAILGAAGESMVGYDLAKLCQKAEHEFAGSPCGIMDQAISVLGQKGRALLLDCRDGAVRQVHFDNPDIVLLVCDTQVKHDLTDGGYAARRTQCYIAAEKLGVKSLRDADMDMLNGAAEKLDEKELMRARHVIGEIDRTLKAVDAMEAGDFKFFGQLMYGSHESLRNDFEVSCEELDEIVEAARTLDGVYGARMTGGGFGGCAIVLVDAQKADITAEAIGERFESRFSHRCEIFSTKAAQGAGVLE